jgi:hypothetical protein
MIRDHILWVVLSVIFLSLVAGSIGGLIYLIKLIF